MPSLDDLQNSSYLTRRQVLTRAGLGGLVLSVGGGLTSLLAACGSGGGKSSGGGNKGGGGGLKKLTVSFADSAPTLDIATSFVGNVSTMMLLTHEQLVTYDNELKLIPHLAASFSQPKPKQYLFKIRDGVTFWDGSPLTQADVLYSLQRNMDPNFGSQLAGYFNNVAAIEASGTDSVAVTMKVADETFPYSLSLVGMVKKSVAEPRGRHYAEPGTPIMGTGPYSVTSFSPNQGMELVRYEKYWGPKPVPGAISVKIIPDETDRQLAMRSGSTMMTYDVSHTQVRQWKSIPKVKVPTGPGLEVSILSFDMSQAPWNDVHVRRAFAHAWNPQFVTTVMGPGSDPAPAMVPKAMWGNLLEPAAIDQLYAGLPSYAYDLDKARAELAQSSHAQGLDAELKVPDNNPSLQKAALSLSENLAKIGVKLTVTQQVATAWKTYRQAHKNLGLQVQGIGPDYPDPADYFTFYISANAVPNNLNIANYKNPHFDALFEQQAGEQDKKKRADLLATMLKQTVEDIPYLGLWWTGFAIAYRSDLMTYNHLTSLCYLQSWTANVTGP